MAYTMLLVDDSSIVRNVLKKTITMAGVEVAELHEAANGAEALQVLHEQWIDLVFLDINMPVMNGVEFMQKVREDDALRDTAVVVVSTEGSKDRIAALRRLGVESYLRKPVTPESLVDVVQEVLGGEQ